MLKTIRLTVNDQEKQIETHEDRPLLDVLREDLQLTGTKSGCGEGECGACTVLVDEKDVRSCITSIAEVEGKPIRTIEGLASEGELHPIQRAFLEHQAMQCGFHAAEMVASTCSGKWAKSPCAMLRVEIRISTNSKSESRNPKQIPRTEMPMSQTPERACFLSVSQWEGF